MNRKRLAVAIAALVIAAAFGPASAPAAEEAKTAVLDATSYWRVLYSWANPVAQTDEGVVEMRPTAGRGVCKCDINFNFMTQYPPDGWTKSDFDDSAWVRRPWFGRHVNGEHDHRAGGGMASSRLRQMSLRGKFNVSEPTRVKGLTLSMSCRGGAIVYLNGREIARSHMPAGEVEPGSPAEMYEKKVYLNEQGKPQAWWPANAEAQAAFALRERKLENVAVPAGALRKGVNVLAVEIHQAAYPAEYLKVGTPWGAAGLIALRLSADSTDGLTPNIVRPAGVQVWNTNICAHLYNTEYGDPNEPLRPIELVGPRNGSVSGRVAVGSDKPIVGLKAVAGGLTGPGGAKIPASAVKVGFGKFDHLRGSRWGGALPYDNIMFGDLRVQRDDVVLDAPPAEVPLAGVKIVTAARAAAGLPAYVDGAIQPVTVVVNVPTDAVPGEYAGTLTISFHKTEENPPLPRGAIQDPPPETDNSPRREAGVGARREAGVGHTLSVPIRMKVIDWTLPDPGDYETFLGLIQSPEAVALNYDVPLWSDKHLALIARSFEMIAATGGKVLFIPLGAESQYGNERSMVSWGKGAEGKFTYDFSAVEKYVDVATKHMPRPRFVVLGVWDSCMHVSVPQPLKRNYPRYTVRDAGGELSNADGPEYAAEECVAFWKPVLTGVKDILAKRKLDDRILLGYPADRLPDKATVENFHKALPGAGWQSTRHGGTGCEHLTGETVNVPVGYHTNVWGGWEHHDPDCRRNYGWRHPIKPSLRTWLDRDLFDATPIPQVRVSVEQALLADRHGLGQIGADFWPVKDPDGKTTGTMVGRFPATNEGNLAIYSGQLLYPAPDGPVPTVRYLMMRENIQECEARIFLEKLLTADPCPLPADLAAKCQAVLDKRTRWHRIALSVSGQERLFWAWSGWEARSAELFESAAAAAKAVAGREK